MVLPPGVMDPLFLHELALELGKTVQELTSGVPGMSAHELCVSWPLFFAYRERERERQQESQNAQRTLS